MPVRRRAVTIAAMLVRPLAAAVVATAALAAPAAADVVYDVNAFTFLNGTAAGSDQEGWSSQSSWETEIDQEFDGIAAADDATTIHSANPTHFRLFAHKLQQDIALETVDGTLRWTCTPTAAPRSAPGEVRITKDGDFGQAEVTVGRVVTQPRVCDGYSRGEDEITMTPGPLKVTFPFWWNDLVNSGAVSHTLDTTVPCGEWTIFQQRCNLRFGGSISITRRAAQPEPTPTPDPSASPTPSPAPTKPPKPPKAKKPLKDVDAKLTKDGAKVDVTCSGACSGKVSATAVAQGKLPAKPVGAKFFRLEEAGTKPVKVRFVRGSTRGIRRRGAVVIEVRSGGQRKTTRLRAR